MEERIDRRGSFAVIAAVVTIGCRIPKPDPLVTCDKVKIPTTLAWRKMTTKFSEWLNARTEKIGGAKGLLKAMPEYGPQHIAGWSMGLRAPGYRAQLQISDIIGVPLSVVRSYLDRPSTEFSELIARKILKHGDFTNFCVKVGISKSSLDKWVAEGMLPVSAKHGAQSKDLRIIRDALIKWGDDTPPNVLMAELVLAAERSIVAKKKQI